MLCNPTNRWARCTPKILSLKALIDGVATLEGFVRIISRILKAPQKEIKTVYCFWYLKDKHNFCQFLMEFRDVLLSTGPDRLVDGLIFSLCTTPSSPLNEEETVRKRLGGGEQSRPCLTFPGIRER